MAGPLPEELKRVWHCICKIQFTNEYASREETWIKSLESLFPRVENEPQSFNLLRKLVDQAKDEKKEFDALKKRKKLTIPEGEVVYDPELEHEESEYDPLSSNDYYSHAATKKHKH